jgi:transcription initiation factor TFIID subunit 13
MLTVVFAVAQLLYGCGDSREPLPETMRVLDEIATDFIQSLSFEAAQVAHYSGRQKVKYDDFEFALRKNPMFLGKVREMFEINKDLKDARKLKGIEGGNLGKGELEELEKLAGGAPAVEKKTGRGRKKKDAGELGDELVDEDDIDMLADEEEPTK